MAISGQISLLSRAVRGLANVGAGLLIFCGLSLAGISAGQTQDAVEETVDDTKTFSFPLKEFRASSGNIQLENARGRDDVYYAISPRLRVEDISLHLDFVNSISLVEHRSQLRVLNNGVVVAQFALDPKRPNVTAEVTIPLRLVKPGFNQLSFEVAQHYTEDCEDPTAPELWTNINTTLSTLTFTGSVQALDYSLAQLDEIISPSVGGAQEFMVLSASSETDTEHLNWAVTMVQALALRLDYIMPVLSFGYASEGPAAGDDEEVVEHRYFPGLDIDALEGRSGLFYGTRDELAPFASEEILDAIDGSFLGIYPLDEKEGTFALIISGQTADEVHLAARSFAIKNFPFIDDTHMTIDDVVIPADAEIFQREYLQPESAYRFTDLNFRSVTMGADAEQAGTLNVEMPADFYVKESDNVELSLDFSYGAGFRSDSVVNIYLNGQFIRAIALDSPIGATFRDYDIQIPARTFIPGANQILFRPVFYSPFGGACIPPAQDNLVLTISGSSEIRMPGGERYTHQPNFESFHRTGFPYSAEGFGRDTAFLFAANDAHTIAAGLTLLAKLTQVSGFGYYNMWTGFELPEEHRNGHVIVVGANDSIASDFLEGAPADLSDSKRLPYPTSVAASDPVRLSDFWSDFDTAFDRGQGNRNVETTDPIVSNQKGSLGRNGVLMAFESPFEANKTMTILTAATPEVLARQVDDLVSPAKWSQLNGDIAVWSDVRDFVSTQRASELYFIGSISKMEFFRYHLSRNPIMWIFGFAVAIIGFSFGAAAIMRERRRLKATV